MYDEWRFAQSIHDEYELGISGWVISSRSCDNNNNHTHREKEARCIKVSRYTRFFLHTTDDIETGAIELL